jgi:hypothetical protein
MLMMLLFQPHDVDDVVSNLMLLMMLYQPRVVDDVVF